MSDGTASNNCQTIVSQIQIQIRQLTDETHIGDDLEARSTRYLVTRFCKRILALATSGENGHPGTPDHPEERFLEWLEV